MSTKYGFDLDDTLTFHPEIVKLCNNLYDAGHVIYIITGGFSNDGEWSVESRTRLLAFTGVKYHHLIRCIKPDFKQIGIEKARVCKEIGISIIFDDNDSYLEEIFLYDSTIQRVKVLSLKKDVKK